MTLHDPQDDARMRVRAKLLADAIQKYDLPLMEDPYSKECVVEWVKKTIKAIAERDWRLAFEIQVGRLQADWTPEDVKEFMHLRQEMAKNAMPNLTPPPGPIEGFMNTFVRPLSADTMHALATDLRLILYALRSAQPERSLPVMIALLLMDGTSFHTVCGGDDRVAIVAELARTKPVYGFVVAMDVYRTMVDGDKAQTLDALLVNYGTRENRWSVAQPYVVKGDQVEWQDLQTQSEHVRMEYDPYAAVFAMPMKEDARPS